MKETKKLKDFENEYYSEIKTFPVKKNDLLEFKIQPKILAYEVYLRKFLGDKFANTESVDDFDSKVKKKVEKLSAESLNNDEFNKIIEDVNNSEFDDNVDMIVKNKGI